MGFFSQTNMGVRKKIKKSQVSVAELYLPLEKQNLLYDGGSWVPPSPPGGKNPNRPPNWDKYAHFSEGHRF